MIWCIVHEEAFKRARQEHGVVKKVAGCPGDEVFETRADAQAFIDAIRPGGPLAAHPIRADWKRDTAPTGMVGVRRLLVDAEIAR